MAIRFLNGIDAEGRRILQVGDPSNSKDAANKAYVDAHTSGVQTFNEGVGIKKSGTSTDVTVSVNYDSGDTDNLIFGANAISAAVGSKPYTPYILAAESNPGVSLGEVKNLRLQDIPLDRFASPTSSISIPGLITHVGNTNTAFGFPGNNSFNVNINGSTRLNVNATNINTYSAEITTSGSPQYFTFGGSGSHQLVFRGNSPSGYRNSIIATDGGSVQLYYANSEKLATVSGGVSLGNNTLYLGQYSGINLNGSGPSAGKAIVGTGTSSQLRWADSVSNVTVGTGLDVSSSTSNGEITKSISLDFTELNDIDGEDPTINSFVVLDGENENAKIPLNDIPNVDTHWKNTQTILTSNFDDRSSSTSIFYMPLNYISETTSANYYNTFACPASGRVKRIRMMHTAGSTMSGLFTTELSILKNGLSTSFSGELTANGTSDGSAIQWNADYAFNIGDRLNFRYQKSATGRYWYGVSVSIIVEFENVN